ncbi:MAG: hypothetical protein JXB06_02590, partial [Spirochaetales bacterium]|nr:hypothetical protein [Spirochaetales bacterium]
MRGGRESSIIEEWRDRGQGHLFEFWDERSPERKQALLDDLDSLDLEVYELLQRQLKRKLEDPGRRRLEPAS